MSPSLAFARYCPAWATSKWLRSLLAGPSNTDSAQPANSPCSQTYAGAGKPRLGRSIIWCGRRPGGEPAENTLGGNVFSRTDLPANRQNLCPLDQRMVKKGLAQFERVRHANLVRLHQEILHQPLAAVDLLDLVEWLRRSRFTIPAAYFLICLHGIDRLRATVPPFLPRQNAE